MHYLSLCLSPPKRPHLVIPSPLLALVNPNLHRLYVHQHSDPYQRSSSPTPFNNPPEPLLPSLRAFLVPRSPPNVLRLVLLLRQAHLSGSNGIEVLKRRTSTILPRARVRQGQPVALLSLLPRRIRIEWLTARNPRPRRVVLMQIALYLSTIPIFYRYVVKCLFLSSCALLWNKVSASDLVEEYASNLDLKNDLIDLRDRYSNEGRSKYTLNTLRRLQ